MGLKIIGAGYGRTGTTSLKAALEMLGFTRCYHMIEVHRDPSHVERWREAGHGASIDWEALFEGYAAAVDWPSCNFWQSQLEAFPEAKVILSEREPDRWYDSVMNTIYPASRAMLQSESQRMREAGEMSDELIWQGIFDGRMEDKQYAIGRYLAHNDRVRREAPRERLLVFDPSQGWAPLCDFLALPVPDEDFPKVNTREQFADILSQMRG